MREAIAVPCDPPRSSGPVRGGVSGGDGVGEREWRGSVCGNDACQCATPGPICAEAMGPAERCARCGWLAADHAPVADGRLEGGCNCTHCRAVRAGLLSPAISGYDPFGRIRPQSDYADDYYNHVHIPPHTPDSARFPIGQRMGPSDDSASVAPSGVRVYQGARERGPLQRPLSAVRGLWDRVQHPRAYLGEPGLQRGAVARDGGAARFRRLDAVCKVRLVAVVDKIRVRAGVKR